MNRGFRALIGIGVAGMLLHASSAAAQSVHIVVLGPERSPIVARVWRNLADAATTIAATDCTRTTVATVLGDMKADTAVCTDGDVVTVWKKDGEVLHLLEAVPVTADDDRTIELIAARVTMAAREGHPAMVQSSMTIVANPAAPDAARDHPPFVALPPPPPPRRIAPLAVLSAGPTLFGSEAGASLGFTAQADIGVARVLALTPWVGILPVPRHITAAASGVGTAEYRPTLFGLGVNIPLLGPSSFVVPRLGTGYALLWVHTWPDEVGPRGVANTSENVFVPVMYATAAASFRVTRQWRVVAEGMIGEGTNQVGVRLAGVTTEEWGQPLASLAVRGEWVLE